VFVSEFRDAMFNLLVEARIDGERDTFDILRKLDNDNSQVFSLNVAAIFDTRVAAEFFKHQSFTTALVTNEEKLLELRSSLQFALENGIGFEKWKKGAVELTGLKNYQIQNIYVTNTSLAYAGGQMASLERSKERFPFWRYSSVMDSRTRPSHRALNGKVFRTGDYTYFPPLGFRCRCTAVPISMLRAKRDNIKASVVSKSERAQLKNADFIGNKNQAFSKWLDEKKKTVSPDSRKRINESESVFSRAVRFLKLLFKQ
jgi:SPP1 gp7 family putative phage head morphogenesis protein